MARWANGEPPDGPTVEWHTIAGYRVSFDRRLGSSRFIVLKEPSRWERLQLWVLDWTVGRVDRPRLIAAGLIEDALPLGGKARVILDDPRRPLLPALQDAMVVRWLQMQTVLREHGLIRGGSEP